MNVETTLCASWVTNDPLHLGNELNAADVFKWTIAKEHVTALIDTTLSDDVPQATAYRAALFKLLTTGTNYFKGRKDRQVKRSPN